MKPTLPQPLEMELVWKRMKKSTIMSQEMRPMEYPEMSLCSSRKLPWDQNIETICPI